MRRAMSKIRSKCCLWPFDIARNEFERFQFPRNSIFHLNGCGRIQWVNKLRRRANSRLLSFSLFVVGILLFCFEPNLCVSTINCRCSQINANSPGKEKIFLSLCGANEKCSRARNKTSERQRIQSFRMFFAVASIYFQRVEAVRARCWCRFHSKDRIWTKNK